MAKHWSSTQRDLFEEPPQGMRLGSAERAKAVEQLPVLLTEAMAVNAKLITIPRSGRPDDPLNSKTPDLRPFSPFTTARGGGPRGVESRLSDNEDNFRVVETISGQKRSLTAVPRH